MNHETHETHEKEQQKGKGESDLAFSKRRFFDLIFLCVSCVSWFSFLASGHGGEGAAWIATLYETILLRAPAPIEVTNWLIDIANGTPPLLIAQAFTGGAEYEANLVTGYYLTYLNRTPSQVEVSGWVSDIEAGLSNEDVIASFQRRALCKQQFQRQRLAGRRLCGALRPGCRRRGV